MNNTVYEDGKDTFTWWCARSIAIARTLIEGGALCLVARGPPGAGASYHVLVLFLVISNYYWWSLVACVLQEEEHK